MPTVSYAIMRGLVSASVITVLFYLALRRNPDFPTAYGRWYPMWALGGGLMAALYWTISTYVRWQVLAIHGALGGLSWFVAAYLASWLLIRTQETRTMNDER